MDLSFDFDDLYGENDVVKPYQYEPMAPISSESENSASESEESQTEDDLSDVSVGDWCDCEMCGSMATPNEQRCCVNMNVVDKKVENAGLSCITEHEGFIANCLNIHVLETSYYDFVIEKGPIEEGQMVHELYRYLAYRRFNRWMYGLMRKRCRKVLPSCAVIAIRKQFPSEEYCGFRYPQ